MKVIPEHLPQGQAVRRVVSEAQKLEAEALQVLLQMCQAGEAGNMTPEKKVETVKFLCEVSLLTPEQKLEAVETVLMFLKSQTATGSIIDTINTELRAMGLRTF